MKLAGGAGHLTYCTNIHAGETWTEVRANLEKFFPAVRDQVAPGKAFGIGLRLSARAAKELGTGDALAEFKRFLAEKNLYVFTINGFPYGTFHGTRVKEEVYLPDWRDEERLRYTDELADLLVQLLPDDVEGSISTVPGAFKPAMRGNADVERIADNYIRHVAKLVEIEERTGKRIALSIEPEPHCYLETIEESVKFFQEYLFSTRAGRRLAEITGQKRPVAEAALRKHVGLCLDLCHAAVEFEDPDACVKELVDAGIRVTKMQVSAGLRVASLTPGALAGLHQFNDPVYLHQVVEQGPNGVRRFADLPEALATLDSGTAGKEWRVHFHVPVFLDELGEFSSTSFFVREMLERHRNQPISSHLEVETYTWSVLPAHLQAGGMEQAIARELNWVRRELRDLPPRPHR
ncbi:MAG TPA: metabolite traffic protein EboE [Burkholderiales bacterium]|nr:metabolite traffic protein EboE [Burkholderiales bacterium]